jgi:nicotinamidase/pyrazinamidase
MQHTSPTPQPEAARRRSLGHRLGLKHGDALLVVDMQRDFLPGGSLAVPGGDEVVEPINAYSAAFDARKLPIYLSRDWHPAGHCSFKDAGGIWPPHCVQGTEGAQWAHGLLVSPSTRVISKATDQSADAYSAFEATPLRDLLRTQHVDRVFVAGVATDYCVLATVLDARKHGLDIVVLLDAIRGVEREPGDESRALQRMLEAGATLFERSRGPHTHAHPAVEPAKRP